MKYVTAWRAPLTSKLVAEPIETSRANAHERRSKFRLHQGALLVLEELDVARPDELGRGLASFRVRPPGFQGTATSVDRLEAGEDG